MIIFKKPRGKARFLRGKQLGFALPIAILIIVVLIVAGGTGYYFYKTSKAPKIEEEVKGELEKEKLEEEKIEVGIFCQDSLDCPSQMKCESSVCVDVGCIKEGEMGPSAGINPEWLEHLPTECCEGLKSITYSAHYDENCNFTPLVGAPTGVCSLYGNGICEEWETKCNCPEDCFPVLEEKPDIQVISPNGGEEWVIGQTYKIEWQSSGLEKVTIDLLAYNSEGQVIKGFQHFIAKSIDTTKGYYNWTIPEIADYPNYKLRIYNKLCIGGDVDLLTECLKNHYFDESDNYFSIISSVVWRALSVCEKISQTSDIERRSWCAAMVRQDPSGCEILSDPETYCYKDVAMVAQDSAICEKIKDPGRRGACEALAERVPTKCSEWVYGDYCYEEVAALAGNASTCDLIHYPGGRTDCQAVVLKDVSYCENSDSEDCYQMLALLTGDEEVCEGLEERDDLAWARDLDYEVNKCIKMAQREITDCAVVSGTGIDCDMIPVVAKEPSWCENLEVNRDRCYFYTALRIADLLPLELILLRN